MGVELVRLGHKIVLFGTVGSRLEGGLVYETNIAPEKVEVNWLDLEKQAYERYKHTLKDFDIIHSNCWYHFSYLAKGAIPELKVCATHHGHLNFSTKPLGVDKMNLIAISRFMAEEYKSILKTDIRYVHNGINLEKYPFKKEKGDRLLYVGRFSSFKQPHIAVEVARRLNVGIDLCGGTFIHPQDRPYLERLKDMCDGQQIKMYPNAPHEVKVKLMQDAKCLLFPSRMGEPFGLVSCEAAACGTPTVALRDGAIAEVVKDGVTGYVCDTTEQMVEAVKKVDEIKPEACRRRIESNFSREIMARNYVEKCYEPVMRDEEW